MDTGNRPCSPSIELLNCRATICAHAAQCQSHRDYNALSKLAYGGVLFLIVASLILTDLQFAR